MKQNFDEEPQFLERDEVQAVVPKILWHSMLAYSWLIDSEGEVFRYPIDFVDAFRADERDRISFDDELEGLKRSLAN